jgi:hypothetical protein
VGGQKAVRSRDANGFPVDCGFFVTPQLHGRNLGHIVFFPRFNFQQMKTDERESKINF